MDFKKEVQSMDLKESIEMAKGLQLISGGVKKVLADGKISWDDTKFAIEMFKDFKVFVDAAQGAKLIPAELKNLSQEEALILVKELFPILKDIKDIVLAVTKKPEEKKVK